MLLLWAILFLVLAITLGLLAFSGVAIAISFFTKVLFFLSLICFIISLILVIIEKMQKKKVITSNLLVAISFLTDFFTTHILKNNFHKSASIA